MSRTEIYNMMENRNVNLSLGSNAFDFNVFNNGTGFFENLTDKIYVGKQNNSTVVLAGLNSPTTWLMELNNDAIIDNQLDDTYSLDDILDGKSILSPASSSITSDFMESPIGSPFSSSDESSYDLNELLLSACPEEVLSSKVESSSIPLAEHMYALTAPVVTDTFNGMSKAECSPVSDDSGFSSGDESVFDSQDIIMQLLNGDFDFSSVLEEGDEQQQIVLTIDESAVSEDQANVEEKEELVTVVSSSNRYSPYKKKSKTPEQKQKKKAQNRHAASRYRNKKNKELDTIFVEAEEMESKNKVLRNKVDGLKTEIDYLKNLMLDVIKARLSNGSSSLDGSLSNAVLSF